MRLLVAAAAIVITTGAAAAEVTIVKGGPRADRGRAEAALADAAAAMGVCWRGKPPPKVRVKLAVTADGAVTATAVSKAGAAQCAAGVLAVWTLPAGPWNGEVEIGAGSAPQDLAATIQQGLLAKGASIKACQSKAPAAAGPVAIKMKIHPDGSITDVAVSSSLGAAIDGCVQKAVAAVRLDALPATAPITYQLAVAFAGKSEAGDVPLPVEAPDGGSVAGPLAVEDVKRVMTSSRARLLACGKKGKGKGTVVTRFTIRPDGSTKNVVVKEPIGDAAIEACLVDAFKSLTFPTASAETKVSYPVAFK
jgi:outer membrane biosynthesis protein TonB